MGVRWTSIAISRTECGSRDSMISRTFFSLRSWSTRGTSSSVIAGPPAAAPFPFDLGFRLLFALSFLIWPLVFLAKGWAWQLSIFLGVTMLLLALNFAGLRWPAFSKLTFGRLLGRYPDISVRELRLQVCDAQNRAVNVRVVGPRENVLVAVSNLVRVYGMTEPGRNEVRAWKLDLYAANGQPLGITTAARTLPLFAMLFAPTALWFVVWLVVRIIQLVGK